MANKEIGSKFIAYSLFAKKGNSAYKCKMCETFINGKVWERKLQKSFGVLKHLDYVCNDCYTVEQNRIKSLTS